MSAISGSVRSAAAIAALTSPSVGLNGFERSVFEGAFTFCDAGVERVLQLVKLRARLFARVGVHAAQLAHEQADAPLFAQ